MAKPPVTPPAGPAGPPADPAAGAAGAADDFARRKAEAELKKLEGEADKLKKEADAVLAPDVVTRRAEAETEKLQEERAKLKKEADAVLAPAEVKRRADAEIDKLTKERDRLERELQILPKGPWMERVKAFGALSTPLLAIAALAGLWASVQAAWLAASRAERETQRFEREAVLSQIRDLAGKEDTLRATAAARLGIYVTDPTHGPAALRTLIFALIHDNADQVQSQILQAIEPAGAAAREPLQRARAQLDGAIAPMFAEAGEEAARRIGSRQQALIKITLALAGPHCAPAPCRPDFGGVISLRGATFLPHSAQLAGAVFTGATVTEADFYKARLPGARFDGAQLQGAVFDGAALTGANFDGANMRRVRRGHTDLARTRFQNADLTGASFVDACLGGADFTGSNADPAALARGFTDGIVVEAAILPQLGPVRSDARCQPIQE